MQKDYSITWQYIVKTMEEKYGLAPDSTVKHPMERIEQFTESIWDDYCDTLDWYYENVQKEQK